MQLLLRQERERRHLNLTEGALLLQTSRSRLWRVEMGRVDLGLTALERYATLLEMSPYDLVIFTGVPPCGGRRTDFY